MVCHSIKVPPAGAWWILAMVCLWPAPLLAASSAQIGYGRDPYFPAYFSGTSNPTGPAQINVSGGNPGYLNGISGGLNEGATGNIAIFDVNQETAGNVEFIALAIHVTDDAGSSHSLSSLGDPALGDIVNDLNIAGGALGRPAYAFDDPPDQYSGVVEQLAAGEAAAGGQPFDIVAVVTFPSSFPGVPVFQWNFDFSKEIGNADGITAISLTDVGALPEPSSCTVMAVIAAFGCSRYCRRRNVRNF